jgi:hypothetical protein
MKVRISFAVLMLGLMTGAGSWAQTGGMTMPSHEGKAPAPLSKSLTITVAGQTATLSVADLQAMPQKTVQVHNAHTNMDESYTGIAVDELLKRYGVTLDGAGAQQVYHSYVIATGTDKYHVLFSASELQSSLHTGDAILAISMDGKSLGADGDIKMVLPGERKPARWVRNLVSLTYVTVQ